MAKTDNSHLMEFQSDPKNARVHTERNVAMIEKSLNQVGSGRSLVATKEGVIIAGNATLDAAASAGFEDVIVVKTNGRQLIVHQREDLSINDPRATKLALYDNRAAELASWDADVLQDFASDMLDIGDLWSKDEQAAMFQDAESSVESEASSESQLGLLEYRVVVNAGSEAKQAELLAELEDRGYECRALIS